MVLDMTSANDIQCPACPLSMKTKNCCEIGWLSLAFESENLKNMAGTVDYNDHFWLCFSCVRCWTDEAQHNCSQRYWGGKYMEEKSVFIVLAHSDNFKVSVDKIKENIFCFCGMHFSDYAVVGKLSAVQSAIHSVICLKSCQIRNWSWRCYCSLSLA